MQNKKFEIKIKPRAKWSLLDFDEIWRFRQLFYIFAWRDIKVRYKQTFLGAGWAIFQPLFNMFIFTIFFGNFAKVPSEGMPYSLFVLIGLVFWTYFSGSLSHASGSLIENENIVKKVYFPKVILPLSSVVTNLIDFFIALIMLFIVSLFLGYLPSISILYIFPIGLIITSFAAGGLGLFLSALNVRFRDVRYILPFFIQSMIFLTPVIYPINIVRPSNRFLMALNPMTGVIESARSVFSSGIVFEWQLLLISFIASIIFLALGLYYFSVTEKFFADIV
jgi:lipopolysaccharide transport system permease protein